VRRGVYEGGVRRGVYEVNHLIHSNFEEHSEVEILALVRNRLLWRKARIREEVRR
jgi:hypothetical protein